MRHPAPQLDDVGQEPRHLGSRDDGLRSGFVGAQQVIRSTYTDFQIPATLTAQTVLEVRHWTDRLFSFTLTRNPGFRFESGQFVLLGLPEGHSALLRPYSMASANYEDDLEFLSIKVPNGPLTSRLQHIVRGNTILVGRKATGTLVLNALLPGENLYLFATGTGLAPFLSLIKDPELYSRFRCIVLTHTTRFVRDLVHADRIRKKLPADEFIGPLARKQLIYYPTVTRESFSTTGRITTLMDSGQLSRDTGRPPLDPATDRVMICGSTKFLTDLGQALTQRGFREGSLSQPASFVVEKAFTAR